MATRNLVPITGELRSINPATGELLATIPMDSDAALAAKLARAAQCFPAWRQTSFAQRSALMLRAAEVLLARKDEFARLMTLEMGKTLRSAVQEVEKSAWGCRFYAEHAEAFLRDEPLPSSAARAFLRYQPLGVVLAVMPWNFPFWQLFRFAAPALMAGNVALLKHASNVPQSAVAIEEVFRAAGFPAGSFQTLLIDSRRVAQVIADPRVRAVTLTGSVGAGSSVAATAGKYVKKTVLELGGSDPFIVMPSADLDHAMRTGVNSRILNNGQTCTAAKRFFVHEGIYAEFSSRFVARVRQLRVGDPLDDATDVGPLATADGAAELERQVARTVALGGRLLTGGHRLPGPGNFFAPTVLADVPPGSPAHDEEMFGPVATLFRVHNLGEALELANASNFGLGSSCWTSDAREQEIFIERIDAGMAFVNGMVASDPRLPFGGVKDSGYGRELSSFGIREFTNAKTVCLCPGQSAANITE
jgi:succinate-semialdehyde dehydrogenase/glutarate-semialdehyde dehydrogenase